MDFYTWSYLMFCYESTRSFNNINKIDTLDHCPYIGDNNKNKWRVKNCFSLKLCFDGHIGTSAPHASKKQTNWSYYNRENKNGDMRNSSSIASYGEVVNPKNAKNKTQDRGSL